MYDFLNEYRQVDPPEPNWPEDLEPYELVMFQNARKLAIAHARAAARNHA
jgi:hypothetical protein